MPSAVYVNAGTKIVLTNIGGDYTFTLKNKASGTGQISARVDLGALPHAPRYRIAVSITTAAAMTVSASNLLYVYLALSDGDVQDGGVGNADAAITAQTQFNNCKCVLVATPDDTGTLLEASTTVPIDTRYVSVGVWNALGVATANTDGTSKVTLTPIYDEIQ